MKIQLLTPILLAATLMTAGVGIYSYKNHSNLLQEGDTLKPFVPPLQNGSIDLKGNYVVSTIRNINATHINVYADYNGPLSTYGMTKNRLIPNILIQIQVNDANQLGIKITDRIYRRFEVPYNNLYPHDKVFNFPSTHNFDIKINQPNLGITISRKDTKEVVFDTNNMFFVFSDLYHEISIDMKDEYIYGLGERRNTKFLYENGDYTFLNKDQYKSISKGLPDQQTYGTHPMYLRREKSGNFHVVFLRNYNSLQAKYRKNDKLTFIAVGGLLEFKIFLGDQNPETSLRQYHSYVNGFTLHPFWAHGFHQCRWGYNTSDKMVTVWETFNKDSIPIDTIWSDIDYMRELTDFTIDTTRYDKDAMNQMLDRTKPEGLYWVPIIDAGIAIRDVSNERGKEMGVYQKSNKTGEDLIGCVWPGKVNYPDFNHPKSYDFWAEGLMNLTNNYGITPSGFWIDMNEFSNFVHGEIDAEENCSQESYLGTSVEDFYSFLPFQVGGQNHVLQEKTMSYDAPKYNEPDAKTVYFPSYNLREFDFHNLNGFSEGIATNQALKKMGNKLPFIISRSQIAGSGQFVQHWTGDNASNWKFLQYSLSEIFNFNMYGIPMTGVDICGFADDAEPEMCARWMQVGAFYPFSRNHNSNDTVSQEPYAFQEDYVLSSSKKSLQLRYALLKQYYAYFVLSKGIGSIFRPTFFNFPADTTLLDNDQQFMISDTLLGQPVLQARTDTTQTYTPLSLKFPTGSAFYAFKNDLSQAQTKAQRYTDANTGKVLNVELDDVMPLFIREGAIVFTQIGNNALRSRALNSDFEIHLALKKENDQYVASGKFITLSDYSDDNLINKCMGDNNCGINIQLTATDQTTTLLLKFEITGETEKTNFENINVVNVIAYAEDLTFGKSTTTFSINGPVTQVIDIPIVKANQQ